VSTRLSLTKIFDGERVGLLFIAPALIVFFVVLSFPIGYAGYLSFFKVKPDFALVYNGLANFSKIRRPLLLECFENTVIYTFGATATSSSIFAGLGLDSPGRKGACLNRIFHPVVDFVCCDRRDVALGAERPIWNLNAFLRQAGSLRKTSLAGSAEWHRQRWW
jgi:hypothetical protein